MTNTAADGDALYRFRFGSVEFNEAEESLHVAGARIRIEPRALFVLQALLYQPRVVVTKEELIASLWGRDEELLSPNVLPNAVSKLRRALGADASAIRTIAGTGYMLNASIERMLVARSGFPEVKLHAGMRLIADTDYVLERELGVTRRHAVWLARATPTGPKRVFKFCVDGVGLSNLKREYTLSRVLDATVGLRDDIVRVLHANFSEPPYWIVSEYGGINLHAWAVEGHLAALSPAERVALVLEVGRAVADAHAGAILHGDLKPANVLMARDGSGRWHPRLGDFGSGWLLDPAQLASLQITSLGMTVHDVSAPGHPAGTPFYIAPELLSGRQATPLSDLYSLGVLAWQIIVGDLNAPMAAGWQEAVADVLLSQDLLAATHLDPAQRVTGVAVWLERLASLDARRAALAEALQAQAREAQREAWDARRRSQRPFKIAAIVGLCIALVASLWSWQRTRSALVQANDERRRTQLVEDFLVEDVLDSANPAHRSSDHPPSIDDLLANASARAAARFSGDPRTSARIHERLGEVYTNLHEWQPWATELEREANDLKGLGAADSDPDLLRMHLTTTRALALQSKFDDAQALLSQTATQAEAEIRRDPDGRIAFELAASTALLDYMRGKYDQAVPSARRALELGDKVFADNLARRAEIRLNAGEALFRANDLAGAERILTPLLDPPFSDASAGRMSIARARTQLGAVESALGHPQASRELLARGRDDLVKAVGPDDFLVAIASMNLADAELATDQFDAALADTRRAADSLHRKLGEDNQATRIADLNLAVIAVFAGDAAGAEPKLEENRRWFLALMHDETEPTIEAIDYHLAVARNELGDGARALKYLDSLDAGRIAQGSPSIYWPARLAGERGRALALDGKTDAGNALMTQAITDLAAQGSPTWMRSGLARTLAATSRTASLAATDRSVR